MSTLYGTLLYMTDPARAPAGKPMVEGYRHGRVPRELREQQLLDVAEQVFVELGFQGASIEEVTRRARIKRPLIYTYFGGKDGLYLACYRRARAALDQRLGAAAASAGQHADEGLHAAITRVAHAYCQFLAEEPSRWEMLYGGGAATAGPIADEVTKLRFRTVELLAGFIRQYVPDDIDDRTILAYAHASSGAGEQLARWWRHTPELDVDQLADLIAGFSWAGMAQLLEPHAKRA